MRQRDIERLSDVLRTTGTAQFFEALRKVFRARLRFDTLLLLRFDPGKAPALLDGWLSTQQDLNGALKEYIDTTYPLHPFYQFADIPERGGLYRLSEIAPDRFFSSEYYLEYYRKIGICDEVGFLAPLASGARVHISMSRFQDAGPFRRRDIQCLKHHAPLILEMLIQHATALRTPDLTPAQTGTPPLAEMIRSHAYNALQAKLTPREAQIAALVMQGHSNGSAAMVLGISKETSKVHRRNLYRKLTISSQRDLFGLLKHLL